MKRLTAWTVLGCTIAMVTAGCGGSADSPATDAPALARFTNIDELVAAIKSEGIGIETEEPLGEISIEGVDVVETRQVKGPDLVLDILRVHPATEKNLGSVATTEASNMQFYWRKPFAVMIHKAPADVDMMTVLDNVFD